MVISGSTSLEMSGQEMSTLSWVTDEDLQPEVHGLPLLGYPGIGFWLIHIVADISIAISIICSLGVIIYMLNQKPKMSFWKRTLSDRLVTYIAMGDFLFSSSHAIDHTALMILRDHPDDDSCIAMAFLLVWFFLAQSLIVLFTAVNAVFMVVFQKRIRLGRYDWKLLSFAMGVPLIIGILGSATRVYGPSGAWCFMDMRKPLGPLIGNIFTDYQMCIIIVMALSYGGIWFKIRRGTKRVAPEGSKKVSKYNKSAKVMTLFVVAYVCQYWSVLLQGFWILVTPLLPVWLIVTMVAIANLGGLFNLLTYTVIRRKFTGTGSPEDDATTIAMDTASTKVK